MAFFEASLDSKSRNAIVYYEKVDLALFPGYISEARDKKERENHERERKAQKHLEVYGGDLRQLTLYLLEEKHSAIEEDSEEHK